MEACTTLFIKINRYLSITLVLHVLHVRKAAASTGNVQCAHVYDCAKSCMWYVRLYCSTSFNNISHLGILCMRMSSCNE